MARALGSRALLPALAVAALIALGVAPARASGAPTFDEAAAAQSLLVASGVGFGAIDVAFAIAWRPLPIVLSLLQVGVAGMLVPAIALDSEGSPVQRVGAAASIVWFTSHGLYNVSIYPEYARERTRAERLRELERKRYGVALQSRRDGAVLSLYGRL